MNVVKLWGILWLIIITITYPIAQKRKIHALTLVIGSLLPAPCLSLLPFASYFMFLIAGIHDQANHRSQTTQASIALGEAASQAREKGMMLV